MTKEYKIGGITVQFPYKAYGPQLAYMSKVVATLEQSRLRQDGKCNALLESPTGSGKSLALLCATLAWQQHYKALVNKPPSSSVREAGSAVDTGDALNTGGGFIVEDSLTGLEPENAARQTETARKVPRIFYATRTHAQITQVIREFRKTKYRVRMAILGSKKHYCTNKQVLKKKNVDEDCLALLRGPPQLPGCRYFRNAEKAKVHDIHDIEDLVKIGHSVKGCAYFAARAMAMEAEIVFCPYSYIVDPIIREAVEADIRGSIIIFDEAHNIEDVAREAGSVDMETVGLLDLRAELQELCSIEPNADYYPPLLETIQDLLGWTEYQCNHLKKSEFERHWSCWTGDRALQELRAAGIQLESFEVLRNFSRKAVAAVSDEEANHLSGRSAKALERLFRVLQFLLQNNARRAVDYQLVVQKFVRRDKDLSGPTWVVSISLWCLNPAVVFEEISTVCRSIIVTSGTLAPVESFASELDAIFDIRLEAPHVVDMETQVWAAALSVGPREVILNASYKNAENFVFQDAVGAALLEIFKVTPDGVLVFLPSYKLLTKLCDRWHFTGHWQLLSSYKPIFIEPRVNDENFESVLQGYYRAIKGELPDDTQKSKKTKKAATTLLQEKSAGKTPTNGAAFLAVCRGKVSEGIDFSDKNARAVVLIGIPFPNVKDIQVSLKKQYNSTHQIQKKLLSGDQWYCQQAFRALNQAVGRCIRHRYDYGGIILLDERFKTTRNLEYMSKWLRKSIRHFDNFQAAIGQLQDFFSRIEKLDLGSSGGTPVEETPDKLFELPLPVHNRVPSPITPVPITPLKSDSGMLRVSNMLLCKTSMTLKNNSGQGGPASSSPCLGSVLLPQFEATEPRLTPSFGFGGICVQHEASGHVETEAGRQFLTQRPYFLNATRNNDEDPNSGPPVLASGICSSPKEERKTVPDPLFHTRSTNPIYSEDENNTVSLTDADGPLYSSINVDGIDEKPPSADGEPRCQLNALCSMQGPGLNTVIGRIDGAKLQNSAASSCLLEQRRSYVSNPNDRPETSGRHEAGTFVQRNTSTPPNARDYPPIFCYRCGFQLASIGSLEITTLQKSYLTTLQNYNRKPSKGVCSTSVYLTDSSSIGSGLTERQGPRSEVSGVCAGNYNDKQQSGVWVEEDGCVFKPLVCAKCTDLYVGVHIIAADNKNLALIDKVAIFVEAVRFEQERKSPKVFAESHCCQAPVISSPSKRTQTSPGKSRLKLRRRNRSENMLRKPSELDLEQIKLIPDAVG